MAPRRTVPRRTVPRRTVPRRTVPRWTVPRRTVPRHRPITARRDAKPAGWPRGVGGIPRLRSPSRSVMRPSMQALLFASRPSCRRRPETSPPKQGCWWPSSSPSSAPSERWASLWTPAWSTGCGATVGLYWAGTCLLFRCGHRHLELQPAMDVPRHRLRPGAPAVDALPGRQSLGFTLNRGTYMLLITFVAALCRTSPSWPPRPGRSPGCS